MWLNYPKSLGFTLAAQWSLAISIRVVSAVAMLILNAALTRILGLEDAGTVLFWLSFVILTGMIGDLGMGTALTRESAKLSKSERVPNRLILFALTIGSSCAILIGTLALHFFSAPFESMTCAKVVLVIFALIGMTANNIFCLVLQGAGRPLSSLSLQSIMVPTAATALLALLTVDNYDTAMHLVFLVCGLSCIVSASVTLLTFQSKTALELSICNQDFLKKALPLCGGIGAVQLLLLGPSILLGAIGKFSEVTILNNAMRLSNLVTFPLAALNVILAPRFAKLFITKQMRRLISLARSSQRISMVFALGVWIFYLASPSFPEMIFGDLPPIFSDVFFVLLIGQTFVVFFGPVGNLLAMTDHGDEQMTGMVIGIITAAAICFIAMYIDAALLFAVAIAAGQMLSRLFMTIYSVRVLGFSPVYIPKATKQNYLS